MFKISIKGVILGIVISLILEIIVAFVLGAIVGILSYKEGMTKQQMHETVVAVILSTGFQLGTLIVGGLCTTIGGYIAAQVAKNNYYMNAAMIGVIGMVLGVLTGTDRALWFQSLSVLLELPAALLGGHLARPGDQDPDGPRSGPYYY